MTDSHDPWYAGSAGWDQLSKAFGRLELVKTDPDYRSLAERIEVFPAAERHAVWISVAQSSSSRAACTRAYLEALHNDPDPASVAWGWLDGDFDLMDKVEHVIGPDDERNLATVDRLRLHLGSILDVGGSDLPEAGTAAPEPATAAEPVAVEPVADELVADEPVADEPVADEPVADEMLPVAASTAEPTAAPVEPVAVQTDNLAEPVPAQPASVQSAAQPAAAQSPAPAWWPTHFVPMGGLPAWDYPDPSRRPIAVLNPRLGLVVEAVAGDWALVRAVNGWRGWVDGRRLTGPG
jgi:hypothetical protein